jgi:hypothetical protein
VLNHIQILSAGLQDIYSVHSFPYCLVLANMSEEIPKKCIAGVVINEGPDFRVEVQEIDVPEPS